mgnify:CR=1 FL=1
MNKVVKKVAAVALSALMVGGIFAGCSSNSNDKKAVDKDVYNVGICQLTQHDALDNATKGFKDKLNALAKADGKTINFDYDSKLAVLCGDYLLAEVLKILADTKDERIRKQICIIKL